MKKLLLLPLAFSLLFLRCKEDTPPTTFWDVLPGQWGFDENYSINGQTYQLSQCDQALRYQIHPSEIAHEACGTCRSSSTGDLLTGQRTAEYGCNTSTFIEQIESPCDWQEYSWIPFFARDNYGSNSDLYLKVVGEPNWWDCTLAPITAERIRNKEVELYIFDDDKREFHSVNFLEDRIEITDLRNINNRRLNGVLIPDTVTYALKRLNSSFEFTIEGTDELFEDHEVYTQKFRDYRNFSGHSGGLSDINKVFQYNGVWDKCLLFGGTDAVRPEYPHHIDDLATLHREDGFTFNIWIKPTNLNKPRQTIISEYNGQYGSYKLDIEDKSVVLKVNDGNGNLNALKSASVLQELEWHQITISTLNDKTSIFINGEKSISSNSFNMSVYDNSSDFYFGATAEQPKGEENYEGYMDEFTIFDTEIREAMSNLLYKHYQERVYDPFDNDISPKTFRDPENTTSVYGEGQIVEGLTTTCLQTDALPGGYRSSTIFYKYGGQARDIVSFALWIKPETVAKAEQIIVSRYNPNYAKQTGAYKFTLEYDQLVFTYYDPVENKEKRLLTDLSFSADEWAYITVLFNKGRVTFYKNCESPKVFEPSDELFVQSLHADNTGLLRVLGSSDQIVSDDENIESNFQGKIDDMLTYYQPYDNHSLYERELSIADYLKFYNWYLANGNFE